MVVSDPAPTVTCIVAVPEIPFILAVIIALPALTAVASPEELMVTAFSLLDVHVT